MVKDDVEKANILNEFFCKMHTEEPETDHMQKFNHESVGSILSRIDVSPEKVRYFLEKLHTIKSRRPDQIHVHVNVLKNVTSLDIPWSILFNKTLVKLDTFHKTTRMQISLPCLKREAEHHATITDQFH